MKIDDQAFRDKVYKSPRLNELLEHFEKIASGIEQIPCKIPEIDKNYLESIDHLGHDEIFNRNLGTFFKHGIASIPYLREEILRVDIALYKLAKEKATTDNPLTYWETSSADGTRARTLAEYANGLIVTLTDSPNLGNKIQFESLIKHPYSFFYHGAFADICPEFLKKQEYYPAFKNKFDIIWENTTFQMYGDNRLEQLSYVSKSLKDDGIMILLEKLNREDINEYILMENTKDDFKRQFFNEEQIEKKKENILTTMSKGQVTKKELMTEAKKVFKYGYIIWNATNFYEIALSNSKENLEKFISYLPNAYVPKEALIEEKMVYPLW